MLTQGCINRIIYIGVWWWNYIYRNYMIGNGVILSKDFSRPLGLYCQVCLGTISCGGHYIQSALGRYGRGSPNLFLFLSLGSWLWIAEYLGPGTSRTLPIVKPCISEIDRQKRSQQNQLHHHQLYTENPIAQVLYQHCSHKNCGPVHFLWTAVVLKQLRVKVSFSRFLTLGPDWNRFSNMGKKPPKTCNVLQFVKAPTIVW